MIDLKNNFPIFANNPGIVYLDNAATTQKPSYVIDGISNFLSNDYANIHRGAYVLSERSEELYFASKEKIAKTIWWKASEIIYTFNATYAFNILAQSMARSWMLKKWDKILISIAEHHANVVPWQILQEDIWIQIEYVNLDKNFDIDLEDFEKKYDDKVKLVSFSFVSNVTGTIANLKAIWEKIRPDTYFAIDASQAIPNFNFDVKDLNADFVSFTGHKMMALTGIGVLRIKKDILKNMIPSIGGWGSIKHVDKQWFQPLIWNEWFEAGTPNLAGAVSMLKALEYIDNIWWYDFIFAREKELTKYALEKFNQLKDKIILVGKKTEENRLGVFSFVHTNKMPVNRIGEIFAEHNICIRAWWHCAHPLLQELGYNNWTCRMSLYFYNDFADIDKFFEILKEI